MPTAEITGNLLFLLIAPVSGRLFFLGRRSGTGELPVDSFQVLGRQPVKPGHLAVDLGFLLGQRFPAGRQVIQASQGPDKVIGDLRVPAVLPGKLHALVDQCLDPVAALARDRQTLDVAHLVVNGRVDGCEKIFRNPRVE
jgi:hypothetical protein